MADENTKLITLDKKCVTFNEFVNGFIISKDEGTLSQGQYDDLTYASCLHEFVECNEFRIYFNYESKIPYFYLKGTFKGAHQLNYDNAYLFHNIVSWSGNTTYYSILENYPNFSDMSLKVTIISKSEGITYTFEEDCNFYDHRLQHEEKENGNMFLYLYIEGLRYSMEEWENKKYSYTISLGYGDEIIIQSK